MNFFYFYGIFNFMKRFLKQGILPNKIITNKIFLSK